MLTVEKGNIISEARKKMKIEFEKKAVDYSIQKKIEHSSVFNKTKIKKMIERNKLLDQIKSETADRISSIVKEDKGKYKSITKDLILQVSLTNKKGLLKLMEEDVTIKCRKSDVEMIKGLIDEITEIYIDRVTNEIPKLKGKTVKCKITINEEDFLPENKDNSLNSCLGGIELIAHRNRIVCNNTLNARLELCYQEALPEIRDLLFNDN